MTWEELVKRRDLFASWLLGAEAKSLIEWNALVGWLYDTGYGVDMDVVKASYHYRLAALELHNWSLVRCLHLGALSDADKDFIMRKMHGKGLGNYPREETSPTFRYVVSLMTGEDQFAGGADAGCLFCIKAMLEKRGWAIIRHAPQFEVLLNTAQMFCEPRALFEEKDLVPPLDPARAIRRWMTHSHCDHTSSYIPDAILRAVVSTSHNTFIKPIPTGAGFPPLRSHLELYGLGSAQIAAPQTMESVETSRTAALLAHSFAIDEAEGVSFSVTELLASGGLVGAEWTRFAATLAAERCTDEAVLLALPDADLIQMGLSIEQVAQFRRVATRWADVKLTEEAAQQRAAKQTLMLDSALLRVTDALGEGNFAVVYAGDYKGDKVAIKILRSVEATDDLWREASTMHRVASVRHPNVIHFYGICEVSAPVRGLAIITEFLENGALNAFLAQRCTTLIPYQLLSFARGAAAGMLHLASQQPPILHRDLSARNLLVGAYDAADAAYPVCVADFGLSRLADASGEYAIVKSPSPTRWTAPEVWDTRKYTMSADIWSFGVTFWEIMTMGMKPYDGLDEYGILKRIKEGYRLPQRSAGWMIPNDCYGLMQACWSTDPTKRPSWREILRILAALEGDARKSVTIRASSALPPLTRAPSASGHATPKPTSVASSLQSAEQLRPSSPTTAPQLPVKDVAPMNPMTVANPNSNYPFGLSLEKSNVGQGAASNLELAARVLMGDSKDAFSVLPRRRRGTDAPAIVLDLSSIAFKGRPSVSTLEFEQAVRSSSPVWSRPHAQLPIEVILNLLSTEGNVSRERFQMVKGWFAPFEPLTQSLPKITELMMEGWFHGDISTAEAARRLSTPPVPCGFLLRFSTSEAGNFALSVLKADGSVQHYRIANTNGRYALRGVERAYDSLVELVCGERRALDLEQGCRCDHWLAFFRSRPELVSAFTRATAAAWSEP